MSLDVYLEFEAEDVEKPEPYVPVRENGAIVKYSIEEFVNKYPDRTFVSVAPNDDSGESVVYSRNITHNLAKMADEVGVYEACWRPDEIGITKAKQLIPILESGLAELISDPDKYKQFNPENGWGDYEGLVDFVGEYLNACLRYPQATVRVWR